MKVASIIICRAAESESESESESTESVVFPGVGVGVGVDKNSPTPTPDRRLLPILKTRHCYQTITISTKGYCLHNTTLYALDLGNQRSDHQLTGEFPIV